MSLAAHINIASETEDNESEESEYDDTQDIESSSENDNEDVEMQEEWESATLQSRLLESRARGRPKTKLKAKNGFVWDTNFSTRTSGKFICIGKSYICKAAYTKR